MASHEARVSPKQLQMLLANNKSGRGLNRSASNLRRHRALKQRGRVDLQVCARVAGNLPSGARQRKPVRVVDKNLRGYLRRYNANNAHLADPFIYAGVRGCFAILPSAVELVVHS